MYITVRYGEKERAILNPNCRCISLLNTIRERSKLQWNADVDLSDESGNVKNLRDFPNKCAADLLEERETLILIKIDRKETGEINFIPLLNDESLTETFYSQLTSRHLNDQSDISRKSSKSHMTPTKELKASSKPKIKSGPLTRTITRK